MILSRLSKFLQRSAPRASGSPAPTTPAGTRVYAIGDVHGRADLLDRLSAQISADLLLARPDHVLTVFLGDYVDRGADSAGVLDRLSAGHFPTPIVALRGNHEEIFLNFLKDPAVLETWRNFGGLETLHSYGVNVSAAMRGSGYEIARDELCRKMPIAHRQFLEATLPSDTWGGYFFCHAGVRPHVPLDQQVGADLYWIREEFLRFQGDFGKTIVHGHTPVPEPDVQKNRINVDTGAFATSALTAVVLEGAEHRFLSTRAVV